MWAGERWNDERSLNIYLIPCKHKIYITLYNIHISWCRNLGVTYLEFFSCKQSFVIYIYLKDDLDEAHEEEEEKKRQTAAGQVSVVLVYAAENQDYGTKLYICTANWKLTFVYGLLLVMISFLIYRLVFR